MQDIFLEYTLKNIGIAGYAEDFQCILPGKQTSQTIVPASQADSYITITGIFSIAREKTCSLCGENKDYFEKEKEEAFNEEKI